MIKTRTTLECADKNYSDILRIVSSITSYTNGQLYDLTHNVILHLYRYKATERYRPGRCAYSTYMYRCVYNATMDQIERGGWYDKEQKYQLTEHPLMAKEMDLDIKLDFQKLIHMCDRLRMPGWKRRVLRLYFLQHTQEQISRKMRIPIVCVMNTLKEIGNTYKARYGIVKYFQD